MKSGQIPGPAHTGTPRSLATKERHEEDDTPAQEPSDREMASHRVSKSAHSKNRPLVQKTIGFETQPKQNWVPRECLLSSLFRALSRRHGSTLCREVRVFYLGRRCLMFCRVVFGRLWPLGCLGAGLAAAPTASLAALEWCG